MAQRAAAVGTFQHIASLAAVIATGFKPCACDCLSSPFVQEGSAYNTVAKSDQNLSSCCLNLCYMLAADAFSFSLGSSSVWLLSGANVKAVTSASELQSNKSSMAHFCKLHLRQVPLSCRTLNMLEAKVLCSCQVHLSGGHGSSAARHSFPGQIQAARRQCTERLSLLHSHLLPVVACGRGHPRRHRGPCRRA